MNIILKNRKQILRSALLLLLLCLLFASCADVDGEQNREPPSTGEAMPYYVAMYRSEQTEFDVDNVTLTIYYGGAFRSKEPLLEEREAEYLEFDLYFENDQGEKYLVRHVDEPIASEKYRCDYFTHAGGKIYFNHAEELTIPKELFTKEEGMIYFSLQGIDAKNPENGETFFCGFGTYYDCTDGIVTLHGQTYGDTREVVLGVRGD